MVECRAHREKALGYFASKGTRNSVLKERSVFFKLFVVFANTQT